MKLIKSKPKYRCGFCRKQSTKEAMERHEKICWMNPDRFCEFCKNKGTYDEVHAPDLIEYNIPCPYCSQKKSLEEFTSQPKQRV